MHPRLFFNLFCFLDLSVEAGRQKKVAGLVAIFSRGRFAALTLETSQWTAARWSSVMVDLPNEIRQMIIKHLPLSLEELRGFEKAFSSSSFLQTGELKTVAATRRPVSSLKSS